MLEAAMSQYEIDSQVLVMSLIWPLHFGVILQNLGSWHHVDITYTVCVSNKLSQSIEVRYVLIGLINGRRARTAQQLLLLTRCSTASQCHHVEIFTVQLQNVARYVFLPLLFFRMKDNKEFPERILYKIIKILNVFLLSKSKFDFNLRPN